MKELMKYSPYVARRAMVISWSVLLSLRRL